VTCIILASVRRRAFAFCRVVQANERDEFMRSRLALDETVAKQQVEEAKQARSRLIRMVMHDLRSPLLSVLNTTATLSGADKETPLGAEMVERSIGVLTTCSTLMETIISDMLGTSPTAMRARLLVARARTLALLRALLMRAPHAPPSPRLRLSGPYARHPAPDFERIEAGCLSLIITPFLVPQLLADAMSVFGGLARVRGIRFETELDPRLGAVPLLDSHGAHADSPPSAVAHSTASPCASCA
jgi:signal transduction histidine kinase